MTIHKRNDHRGSPQRPVRRSLSAHVRLFVTGVASAVACGGSVSSDPAHVVCGDPVPAFGIRIRNASSGQFTAGNALVIATAGSYADTVRVSSTSPDSVLTLVGYRPGTYTVLVRKTGFLEWQAGGLLVPAAPPPCEGNPASHVDLDARLQSQQ